MKTSQKGFALSLLIAIIAILSLGGGAYIYESKKNEVPPAIIVEPETVKTEVKTPVSVTVSLPTQKVEFESTTIKALSYNPKSFLGKKLQVTGKLISTGENYFTDSSFAVTDGTNNFKVSPWLALEVPPPMPGSTTEHPPTMSTYLDKTVTLQGVVEQDDQGFFLKVITKL